QDIIHQIEYRWHDRRDLSPIASTMSPDSLRGWDSWIRTWVRHPHVEGLGESVCYQVQPNGRAAIAWRYQDWQAAGEQDGTRGRPLVSRVLAGQSSQLTAEVAIALCHTGLPKWAGPPPGRVATDADLAGVGIDALTGLAREQAARLDAAVAAQQDCLLPIVAPALADSHTPIAVHLADADILKPPGQGLPCLVLWGLWRIVSPVLGTGGRGWSFSTFELPLGDVDPATMPDILFRQAQYTSRAVARPRKELKLRLFESRPADEASEFFELATWLLAEFAENGGHGLRQLIGSWQGADKSVQPRISRIYEELRARRSPATPPGPLQPSMQLLPSREWQRRSEPKSEPMRVEPVIVEPARVEPALVEPTLVEPAQPAEPAQPEAAEAEAATSAETAPAVEEPRHPEQLAESAPLEAEPAACQSPLADSGYLEPQSVGKHRAADSAQYPPERNPQEQLRTERSQHRHPPARH